MGDRNNIILKFEDGTKIYFYTHWGGSSMADDLRQALHRGRGRWSDPPYLARIIFSELIKNDILGETGYGIAPYECDQDCGNTQLEVDLDEQTVNAIPYEEFISV